LRRLKLSWFVLVLERGEVVRLMWLMRDFFSSVRDHPYTLSNHVRFSSHSKERRRGKEEVKSKLRGRRVDFPLVRRR